jgi:hypothetical protein
MRHRHRLDASCQITAPTTTHPTIEKAPPTMIRTAFSIFSALVESRNLTHLTDGFAAL